MNCPIDDVEMILDEETGVWHCPHGHTDDPVGVAGVKLMETEFNEFEEVFQEVGEENIELQKQAFLDAEEAMRDDEIIRLGLDTQTLARTRLTIRP